MEVHLIRHTPVNISKKICYGRLDVPLLDSFNHDILKIKNLLLNKYDIVFTSPSKRCIALAEALKFSNIIKDNRLFELSFGDWEGVKWDEIDENLLNHWMEDFVNVSPTNGESFYEMYLRVSNFIEQLRNKDYNDVLIISHSGVIRCFLAYLLKFPLNNSFKIPVGFYEQYIFKIDSNPLFDSIVKMR
tara:strand:+ start:424 stop:987 length:564 start_codon:yes stop_codon:yes gene_type:complete